VRSYKGYWVGSYPPPSPASNLASQAHLATRPMTAIYSTGSEASAGGYSQSIDVNSLTAGTTKKIPLPNGAVGNTYALTLNLTNCVATDNFSWTVSKDATGGAAIAPSGGANQAVRFSLADLSAATAVDQPLQVTVQLTKTSATPPVTYTLLFEIAVIKCAAISVEPTVLPPVVVGTAYTQNLVARGASGSFTWSVDDKSLPPGLTWDPSSHKLSGNVTDATQVGNAFSLVLGVAASDVIMDPQTAPLNITTQSAPAVASSSMPPWEMRLILLGSSLALAALVTIALSRLLRGKANPKTVEAIEAGWTNIGNATGRDPKSVGQSIVQSENATAPILERKIPDLEALASQYTDREKYYADKIFQEQVRLEMLEAYVNRHPLDGPDDPVRDQDLNDLGYEKYDQVTSDIPRLTKENEIDRKSWSAITSKINSLRAETVLDHNKINETDITEPNDKRLLGFGK
jgi:hypothetical protein